MSGPELLLIHPPATKPGEPPLGTAILLDHLRRAGVKAAAIDANLESCLYHLDAERLSAAAGDRQPTALRRALRHAPAALELLRSPRAVDSFARYATAVRHLDTALGAWRGLAGGERWGLGDYQHDSLSPFAPEDLERLGRGEASTLFRGYFEESLLPRIDALQPKLISLSINYLHQVLPAFELAGLLARRRPDVKLIAGGGMVSSWAPVLRRLGLRLFPFSHLIFGPGEEPLVRLAAGESLSPLVEGGGSGFRPDFSDFDLSAYLSPLPVLPVAASRGCYWRRCLFCPEAAAPTQAFAQPSPAEFPGLLLDLSARYGVGHFHLTDNAIPLSVLRALATRAGDLGRIGWHGFVRFEPALEDEGLVRQLAASGCRLLQLGLESGSQAVLDRLGKGTRLETAARILANLRRAGIAAYVYVMLGTPGESEADALATLDFLEAHAESIGFLNLAIMNLPRDSEMLADPAAFGIAGADPVGEEEPLGLYRSFAAASGWDRAAARRFLDRRLLASPAIRTIVQRTPPLFTSNHAFLFPPRST